MMYEAQVHHGQGPPLWVRIDAKLWEGKLARVSPKFNGGLDFWGPEQVGLLGRLRGFWQNGRGTVHVVAADLVLCAIAADFHVSGYREGACYGDKGSWFTIVGMSRHSECASSCKFCNPFETLCGCAWKDHRRGQPF